MTSAAQAAAALAAGRDLAGSVIAARDEALAARREELTRLALTPGFEARAEELAAPAALVQAAGGPANAGVLVAEGDSWFDYPWLDVLGALEDHHGFEIESVAHKGDRVEDMAYTAGQLSELTRRIEKVLRRGVVPRAILLSGGGNDIAGDEFGMLLNHAASAASGLNQSVVTGVIDERLHLAYLTILGAVTALCEARLGRKLPIVLHGYDYPVADGRGFLGGWWVLPGPWLEPGFRQKGYSDMAVRAGMMRDLIDRFNAMLENLVAHPDLAHVRYVNLRGTLSTGADYEDWWANELHPTKRGFLEVARKVAAVL